jgi:hypothetical protein
MTLAVVDRLAHHTNILEMNVENYMTQSGVSGTRFERGGRNPTAEISRFGDSAGLTG